MSCPNNSPRTFVLKLNLHCAFCGGCVEQVETFVRKIDGVRSIKVDTEQGVATISGNVDPHTIIKDLEEKKKIKAQLVVKENDQSKVSEQKPQIGSSQNLCRTSHRVSPQPPEQGKATGEAKSLSKVNKQNLKTISTQNHPSTSRRVSPQPPEQGKATGEAKSLSKVNKQNLKTISTQNHRSTSHRVSPQPPDLSIIAIGEPNVNTIRNCCPEHKHNWELKKYNKPFICNGCKEEGFGSGYRCESCNHDLHEECKSRKPKIIHEHFDTCTLEFSQKPGNLCDACGRKIYGYSYSCTTGDFDLHPRCAKLREKLCIDGMDFVLQKKAKGKCFWCKKKQHSCDEADEVQGWCYVSMSKHDKFYCHVYCVSKIVQKAWKTGHLDGKDNVDDAPMVLGKLDLKPGASLEKSRGGVGNKLLKIVAILLKTVISILFGDPIGLTLSLLEVLFAK